MLFVCTGNLCRSPMAEGLFRRRASMAGVAVDVASCGLIEGGRPCPPHVFTVMEPRQVDLMPHLSQPMSAELVRSAHLVLGMERQHVREAVVLAPGSFARTFTLRDFVWRAQLVGPRGHAPLPEWLALVGNGRRTVDVLGADALDEVTDPMGQSLRAYQDVADELEDLVDAAFDLLLGAVAAEPPPSNTDDDDIELLDLHRVRHHRERAAGPVVPDAPAFGLRPDPPFASEGELR